MGREHPGLVGAERIWHPMPLVSLATVYDPNGFLVGAPAQADKYARISVTNQGAVASNLAHLGASLIWPLVHPDGYRMVFGQPWSIIYRVSWVAASFGNTGTGVYAVGGICNDASMSKHAGGGVCDTASGFTAARASSRAIGTNGANTANAVAVRGDLTLVPDTVTGNLLRCGDVVTINSSGIALSGAASSSLGQSSVTGNAFLALSFGFNAVGTQVVSDWDVRVEYALTPQLPSDVDGLD